MVVHFRHLKFSTHLEQVIWMLNTEFGKNRQENKKFLVVLTSFHRILQTSTIDPKLVNPNYVMHANLILNCKIDENRNNIENILMMATNLLRQLIFLLSNKRARQRGGGIVTRSTNTIIVIKHLAPAISITDCFGKFSLIKLFPYIWADEQSAKPEASRKQARRCVISTGYLLAPVFMTGFHC